MSQAEPNITVKVDLTNPGQFFACCGLLELADRLWPGAEGWFDSGQFHIICQGTIAELLQEIIAAPLEQLDLTDETASAIQLGSPFNLRLDWWNDEIADGKQFKAWAGRMNCIRIASAMRQGMRGVTNPTEMLDYAAVVYDPDQPTKKVEPFYYDSRRGWNAQSRDIGFAPDSLSMTTAAYPAVEFLCIVGLQRFRPPDKKRRVFDYTAWARPAPVSIAGAILGGLVAMPGAQTYRFENAFRTDQRKHKSFLPATPIGASK